jgi:hypothetical protein
MVATIGTIVRSGEILFHGSVWLNCIDARFEALAILNRIKVEMSDDDETLRLLEVEYQRLGTTIDKFDEQRFKVKGWTMTAAGALVALGINTRQIALLIAGGADYFVFRTHRGAVPSYPCRNYRAE